MNFTNFPDQSLIADFHMHSKYARACSKDLDIKNIETYAKLKGLSIVGTGDFTHPKWIEELKRDLTPNTTGKTGIYETKTGFPFIYQTEISLVYSQGGKGRRVHLIVLAPSHEVAVQITDQLKKHGRVDYDGRPIFGMSCISFVEEMIQISKEIEIIPAHAWTPWFALFGSNSGFDSIKDCFQDQLKHIHAIETGLSSDPPMNWRLSQLDNINLVSFSDSHSYWPWRMGREATVFSLQKEILSYIQLIKAIRTGEQLWGTIEVNPNLGKYHATGHRNCKVCLSPADALKVNNICPQCRSKLTVGVDQRIEALADPDRPLGFKPKNAKEFASLIPLSELIASLFGKAVASKGVFAEYHKLIKAFGSEFNILLSASKPELESYTTPQLADVILLNREGKIEVKPGYDGVYGVPLVPGGKGCVSSEEELDVKKKIPRTQRDAKQKGLDDF